MIVLILVVGCTGTSPTAPIITSFLADPLTITVGESSTLSWSVTDATTVTIDQSIGSVALVSTTTVSPTTTTTYTLTATNAAGSVTATTTVTVNPVATAPTINSFLANPTTITVGESSTLSWSVTDATTVTIDQSIGSVASTDTTTVSPTTTTTYTLTATNAVGSVTATTTITVNPAPTAPIINSFSANPTTITVGESSTLSWSVTDATSVTIDQSIGSVALISTTTVSPATTTTYTLTATNAAGSVTATTTVTVNPVATTYGDIDVKSIPTGAKVYLDGVNTGSVTPYVITHVEIGIHTIKLDKNHYKIQEDTNVSVNAGETTYLNWALTYASTQYITLQPGSEGKDSGVSSFLSTMNYGNSTSFFNAGNQIAIVRAFIEFDLSSVPVNARVTDTDLMLYHWNTSGTTNFSVGAYKITESWEEDTITYLSQPIYSSEAEYSNNITAGNTEWENWDIDTLVQSWLDGTFTNNGVVLKATDESSLDTIAAFRPSDYSSASYRPKLVIDYYIP